MKLDRSLSVVLAISCAFNAVVSHGIETYVPPRIVVGYSQVGENCRAALLDAAADLVKGPVAHVSFTSLAGLRFGLSLSGLDARQGNQTARALQAVLTDAHAPRVIQQVSASLLAAENDDSLLGICALNQNCQMARPALAVHVSAHHPFSIQPFFGGKSGSKLSWTSGVQPLPVAGAKLWQGFVIKPDPHLPDDLSTLVMNVDSLLHEAGYFDAMARLAAWALYVQSGGTPHPRIAKYISDDGKRMDIGFIRLVMESRATRSELEAQDVLMRLCHVPDDRRSALQASVRGHMLMSTLESIHEYGTTSQTALTDFAVTPERLYDLAEQLIDFVDWRE